MGKGRAARLVTLSTDLGSAYAAQMKAVLHHYLPPGHVVDLAHDLAPHRIAEAAFLVRAMARGFPAGTVHVAVVDPGVGGRRAPVAIACRDGSYLVGPNNGLLVPLAEELGTARSVQIRLDRVTPGRSPSATFEGRDVFAPAAGLLATGTQIASLGAPVRLARPETPAPTRRARLWIGRVVHIDRFGNLITNIPGEWGTLGNQVRVRLSKRRPVPVLSVRTYEELRGRSVGLLTSSFGLLELSVREDSLARRWRASVGDPVEIVGGAKLVRAGSGRPKMPKEPVATG